MKLLPKSALALLSALVVPLSINFVQAAELEPLLLADPMVGTSPGKGTQYPGAALPNSLVKLSPDTTNPWTAGYHPDEPIVGFSHTHISGTSSTAFAGQVLVRPQTGALDVALTASPKKNEKASPGFYSVTLTRDQVNAELTLTERSGVHRYTFPDTGVQRILIDGSATLNNSKKPVPSSICTDSESHFVGEREIEGVAGFIGGYTKFAYKIYFVARFDQTPTGVGSWLGETATSASTKTAGGKGEHAGLYAEFAPGSKPIGLRIGISYTSIANARKNLDVTEGQSFDQVRTNAENIWRKHFDTIQVTGGSDLQRRQFYTSMYHSILTPTNATGDQGPWPSNEPAYWDLYCIWDTFRSAYPLNTLLYPKMQSDFIRSLLDVYKHNGWLRDGWAYQKVGFALQGGTNADVVIADAVVKKLGGFDLALAYEAVKKNATVPSSSKIYSSAGRSAPYFTFGYVPGKFAFDVAGAPERNEYSNPVSTTLEYAYNDFAVAAVADAVGAKDDAKKFRERSLTSFNLFNPETKFFWGKTAGGEWVPDFDPKRDSRGPYALFYEGSAWHYRFTAPHDIQGLINRLGGKKAFVEILDEYFDGGHDTHDNEPTFLTPWLYNYAGRPDKTADRVSRTLAKSYKMTIGGYPGDEDNGAMSSWYIFGAIGFYPNAGQDVYLINTPMFDKSVMRLGESGKTLTIKANKLGDSNRYVQSATLNGKPWNKAWFRHGDIIRGAELVLNMGDKPSAWGSKNPPPSLSAPL